MLSPANRPFTKSENLRVYIFSLFFRLCSFRNPESYQTEWSERETFPDKTKRLAEKGGGACLSIKFRIRPSISRPLKNERRTHTINTPPKKKPYPWTHGLVFKKLFLHTWVFLREVGGLISHALPPSSSSSFSPLLFCLLHEWAICHQGRRRKHFIFGGPHP